MGGTKIGQNSIGGGEGRPGAFPQDEQCDLNSETSNVSRKICAILSKTRSYHLTRLSLPWMVKSSPLSFLHRTSSNSLIELEFGPQGTKRALDGHVEHEFTELPP